MVKSQPYGPNMTIIDGWFMGHHHKLWSYYSQNFSLGRLTL